MKGIILKTNNRCATIMTRDGSFVDISARRGARIGQEVDFLMSKATKVVISSLVSLALIVSIGTGGYLNYFATAHSFVTVDINPSVDLELNAFGQVIDVIPNNADAEVILSQTSVKGMNVSEAVCTIAELAVQNGYLDPNSDGNSILVSGMDSEGTDMQDKLDTIVNQVKTSLANRSIKSMVLTEVTTNEIKSLADEMGVSPGKLLLMEKSSIDGFQPYIGRNFGLVNRQNQRSHKISLYNNESGRQRSNHTTEN